MDKLRDYQTNAIHNLRQSFLDGYKKLLLVSPTGSGKTVIASSMLRQAQVCRTKTMFVAHRRELVMQCSKKLYEFGVEHGVIMANKSPNPFASVQVCSIQTFTARKDKFDFDKPEANLIILDEAHRSTSNSFQQLIKEYPEATVIGLTATPIRSDGQGLGHIYEKLIECASINDLIEQGYLVPSNIVAPTIPDLKGIKVVAGDYDKKVLDTRMNVPKLIGDIVKHWREYAQYRPTVVFCTSIKHSKYVANIFNDNGIPAGHVDGEMPEVERERQLQYLKDGKIMVLSNCMVLTEGWDCPKVSCVIIARPTKSYGLYLQMVGRSLRPYPNKKDTLIIDHAGCVYEHGFPEEVPEWKLTMSKVKTKSERIIQPIEKQPLTCMKCHTVYKPTKEHRGCPNCSFIPTKKEVQLLIKEGRLIELPKPKPEKVDIGKKEFYGQVLYYSRQKGYNDGWASYVFKEKFGHYPYSKKIMPQVTTPETLSYIKHYNIKQAKRREKIKQDRYISLRK